MEKKWLKKDWWKNGNGILFAAVMAGICILLIMSISYLDNKGMTEKASGLKSENIDLSQKLDEQGQELKNARDSITLYKKMYNKCAGVLTPEERIAQLEEENARLKKNPVVVVKYKTKPASTPAPAPAPKNDIAETKFESSFIPSPTTPVVDVPTENDNLVTTKYKGVMSGDYGTTIEDESGRKVYFFKNSLISINNIVSTEAPRLNGPNGEKFTLNAKTGYWYYVDGKVTSISEINSWVSAVEWNAWVGIKNYGTGSYDVYIPHEGVKALINRVRGREYGEITDEDLYKMKKINPNIWTPTSEGTIKPFRLNSTSGRAYGKEDKQLYQGWNFRTRIVAVEKTTVE